ncbi:transposase [Mesorhizobium caraganae]|nr:transposase [Mesorhizobium caraganae]
MTSLPPGPVYSTSGSGGANYKPCRRFMTIPGVGPVTALAFKTAIDDLGRFRRWSDLGEHLGLTWPRAMHR